MDIWHVNWSRRGRRRLFGRAKARHIVRARRAASQLAARAGISATRLAPALGVSHSCVRRLAADQDERRLHEAIRTQLSLRATVLTT
jgi:hypothetical protein